MSIRFIHPGTGAAKAVGPDLAFFQAKSAVSIYFRIKFNTRTGTSTLPLLSSKQHNFVYSNAFGIAGAMFALAQGTTTQAEPITSSFFNDSLWHTVVITITGGDLCRLYIDGTLLATSPFPDATTANLASFFIFGFDDQDGLPADHVDFNVDCYVAWNNLILTADQANSLTSASFSPTSIGTSGNRIHYDFTQTLDSPAATAFTGDLGTVDLDQSVALTLTGNVQWDNSVYSYTPTFSVAPATVKVGTSGGTVQFAFVDANGITATPSNVASPAVTVPSVSINSGSVVYLSHDGTPTGRQCGQIIANVSIFRLPTPVNHGDVVSVTVPHGLYKNSLGALNPSATITAFNSTGIAMPAFTGTVAAGGPGLGVNSTGASPYTADQRLANLVLNSSVPSGKLSDWYETDGAGVATKDSNGNPTGISGQTGSGVLDMQIGGGGNQGLIAGTYTLLWTGSGDAAVIDYNSGSGVTAVGGLLTSGSVKRRKYAIVQATAIVVRLYAVPATNVQLLYSADVDGTGFAAKGIAGSDWTNKYKGIITTYRDVSAANNMSRGWADRTPENYQSAWLLTAKATVTGFASVDPVALGLHEFDPLGTVNCYHATCSGAHGFVYGQILNFSGTGGPTGAGGIDGVNAIPVIVDSPTTFYVNFNVPAVPAHGGTAQAWTSHDPSGLPFMGYGSLQNDIASCNAAGMRLHWCSPVLWSDADITAAVTYIANNLTLGMDHELVNENWNVAFLEASVLQFFGAGKSPQLTWPQMAAQQAAHTAHVVRAAWAAANRTPSDLKTIWAWQAVDAPTCATLLTRAQTYWTAQGWAGSPFDRVYVAPYTGSELSYMAGNQPLADFLFSGGIASTGQVLDFAELTVFSELNSILGAYKTQVADVFGVALGCYEWMMYLTTNIGGGNTFESGLPSHNYPAGTDDALTALYLAAVRDKRAGLIEIASYNLFAAYGLVQVNYLGSIGEGSKYGSGGQYEWPYQVATIALENSDLTSLSAPYAPKAGALAAIAAAQTSPFNPATAVLFCTMGVGII